jgi:putative FmdB family regulatory protein
MPLYDFRCRTCGREFEGLVRGTDTPACPACEGHDLERLPSTFAVSSEERTRTAAKASRRQQIHARRDKLVADEEARQHHDD